MEFGELLVGYWNDPHMLAGCLASAYRLQKDTSTERRRSAQAWTRYAIGNQIDSIDGWNTTALAGLMALPHDPLARAVVQLHQQTHGAFEQGRRQIHVRLGIAVTRPILVELGSFNTSTSARHLWLARRWLYADIVSPWRMITEDVITQPRKARPIPSPVPADVSAAIEACLEANEPEAARAYYDGWHVATHQEQT